MTVLPRAQAPTNAVSEQHLSLLDPGAEHVPQGALARAPPELPREVEPAHPGRGGEVVERDPLTEVRRHVVVHPA